jgi:hypothetical protein
MQKLNHQIKISQQREKPLFIPPVLDAECGLSLAAVSRYDLLLGHEHLQASPPLLSAEYIL